MSVSLKEQDMIDTASSAIRSGDIFIQTHGIHHPEKPRGVISVVGGLKARHGFEVFLYCPVFMNEEAVEQEAYWQHYHQIHLVLLQQALQKISESVANDQFTKLLDTSATLTVTHTDDQYLYYQDMQIISITKRSEIRDRLEGEIDLVFRGLDACYEDDYPVLVIQVNSLRRALLMQTSTSLH